MSDSEDKRAAADQRPAQQTKNPQMMTVLRPRLLISMSTICTLKTIIFLHWEMSGQNPRNLRELCFFFLRLIVREKRGPFLQKARAGGVEPPASRLTLTPLSHTPRSYQQGHMGTPWEVRLEAILILILFSCTWLGLSSYSCLCITYYLLPIFN
jgi:hypothetical protein